jgi:shikimate dehydrogenase
MKYSFMKHYALIGYPLGHSFSKTYFEQKFETENIQNSSFELFSIEHVADIKAILQHNPTLQGLAVTIPHKQTIIPYLSSISNEAKTIGAVNCIKVQAGKLFGYNTDVVGFENSLKPLLQKHHTHALILGTGGASKAVQYVLNKLGISFLLVSRAKSNQPNIITYNDINESIIENNTIIINTTPVGMSPNDNEMPSLPYHLLTPKHLLYDLIYKPAKTQFLLKGQGQGCTTKNGFEMLQLQAEENWKIWNE